MNNVLYKIGKFCDSHSLLISLISSAMTVLLFLFQINIYVFTMMIILVWTLPFVSLTKTHIAEIKRISKL